jgi:hypothetical protein
LELGFTKALEIRTARHPDSNEISQEGTGFIFQHEEYG